MRKIVYKMYSVVSQTQKKTVLNCNCNIIFMLLLATSTAKH